MTTKIGELGLTNVTEFNARRSYLIGCGGMGSSIVDAAKGRYIEYFNSERCPALQFLSFDTALQDVASAQQYLTDAERQRVYSLDLNAALQQVEQFPGIREWYEETELSDDLRNEIITSVHGAATTRPFGRVGLFEKWQDQVFSALRRMLDRDVALRYEGKFGTEMHVDTAGRYFYIATSVGGGTGTGIFFDVAATIRHLQQAVYKEEAWYIIGIFVLPELLIRHRRVLDVSTSKIMANSYAALKELDHFLHGHAFHALYGPNREVILNNEKAQERLFNLVFLLDVPNVEGQYMREREDMAAMAGEAAFHLTATEVGADFYRRFPDLGPGLIFIEQRPQLSREEQIRGVVKEQRKTVYGTFGLCTLELPIQGWLRACAYDMATEILHLLFAGEALPREELDRLAERYTQGEAAEAGILSRLGLTREQLDTRFAEFAPPPLPTNTAIFDNRDPIRELRTVYNRITLLQGEQGHNRQRDLERRRQEERERLIDPPGKGELEHEVDKILEAHQNMSVADHVLAKLRENVQQLQADYVRQLRHAQDERTATDHAGQIEGALQYLESNRPSFFVRHRVQSRLGTRIRGCLQTMREYQRILCEALLLPPKLHLLEDVLEEIDRLDRQIPFDEHIRNVRDEIAARKRQEPACQTLTRSAPSRRRVLRRYDAFYQRFLAALPEQERPAHIAARIVEEGLPTGRDRVRKGDFDQIEASAIAEALLALTMPLIAIAEDTPVVSKETQGGVKRLWQLDFADAFFEDVDGQPDDFDDFKQELETHGAPWLPYNGADMPNQELNYVFSGSRLHGSNLRTWGEILNRSALTTLPSRQPNQVSLLSFRLGFPLYRLRHIETWQDHYERQLERGMPLHLFKGAAEKFQEPFFEQHQRIMPEELFEHAVQYGVITQRATDDHAFDHDRREITQFFMEKQRVPKPVPRTELLEALRGNAQLRTALAAVIEHQRHALPAEVQEKLRAGAHLLAEELLTHGLACGILRENPPHGEHLLCEVAHPTVRDVFTQVQTRRRQVGRDAFLDGLRKNQVLYGALLDHVVERIIEQEGAGIFEKIQTGRFPDFLREELEEELRLR
jgi:hypothetical protein